LPSSSNPSSAAEGAQQNNNDGESTARCSKRPKKQRQVFQAGQEDGLGSSIRVTARRPIEELSKDALACHFWDHHLKPEGWRHYKAADSDLEDWIFIPATLADLKTKDIRDKGTQGVHYAIGWPDLYEMIMNYAEFQEEAADANDDSSSIPIITAYDVTKLEQLRQIILGIYHGTPSDIDGSLYRFLMKLGPIEFKKMGATSTSPRNSKAKIC
jgi:hypothetical protein